ncbi:hypothetical protein Btru_001751 [Bulinus truncatus]|nr:hypothetical protein Btru_001751 [Bulinus truncatus]
MATVPKLRLYDINANIRQDRGAYHDYRSPSVSSLDSLSSPLLQSPTIRSPRSPLSPSLPSPIPSPLGPPVAVETRQDIEYTRAPDTFPCGHVLCHNCVRKFMRLRQRSGYSRCPVCHQPVDEDAPLQAMGIPTGGSSHCNGGGDNEDDSSAHSSHGHTHQPEPSDPTPISLLNNFDEIVEKFNGIQLSLRRLKNESVQSKSMGMTFTNTQCHLCMENHGTLRVVQEFNQLSVRHERPTVWSPYFYRNSSGCRNHVTHRTQTWQLKIKLVGDPNTCSRPMVFFGESCQEFSNLCRLQQGKVVTEFYSQVNSSCICVPCTYRELKLQNHPDLRALPNVNPQQNTQICLAEVGKIVARNSAPIMALQGKNVIEIDHTIRLRERADQFNFLETADQIEHMVKQQEESLIKMASKQIRDTGRLYHTNVVCCRQGTFTNSQSGDTLQCHLITPIVIDPLVSGPLIIDPLVIGLLVIGPLIILPLVIGPLVIGPLVIGPLVSGPLVIGPLVIGPLVISPFVIGPLVIGPLVNDPQQRSNQGPSGTAKENLSPTTDISTDISKDVTKIYLDTVGTRNGRIAIQCNFHRLKQKNAVCLHVLILSLSLADILQGLFQTLPYLLQVIIGEWSCGELMCKIHAVARAMLANVSISTLAIIAFNSHPHGLGLDRLVLQPPQAQLYPLNFSTISSKLFSREMGWGPRAPAGGGCPCEEWAEEIVFVVAAAVAMGRAPVGIPMACKGASSHRLVADGAPGIPGPLPEPHELRTQLWHRTSAGKRVGRPGVLDVLASLHGDRRAQGDGMGEGNDGDSGDLGDLMVGDCSRGKRGSPGDDTDGDL